MSYTLTWFDWFILAVVAGIVISFIIEFRRQRREEDDANRRD